MKDWLKPQSVIGLLGAITALIATLQGCQTGQKQDVIRDQLNTVISEAYE